MLAQGPCQVLEGIPMIDVIRFINCCCWPNATSVDNLDAAIDVGCMTPWVRLHCCNQVFVVAIRSGWWLPVVKDHQDRSAGFLFDLWDLVLPIGPVREDVFQHLHLCCPTRHVMIVDNFGLNLLSKIEIDRVLLDTDLQAQFMGCNQSICWLVCIFFHSVKIVP